MSVRRYLVDCAVLSLQDARVFYPCCKGCFSRIDAEERDATRYRCSRCGYRCLRDQVAYRYRLSLRVTRDRRIFGVTVFGNNLNPFFGVDASELQRFVENFNGSVKPSTRFTLLVKAVEDCFIGRHFIFGFKLSRTETGPWLEGPASHGSGSRETAQFVASQMILPIGTGLAGCTVLSYYQSLLQKASEDQVGSADPSKNPRFPAPILLLIPDHSPTSSYNNSTLCASGLISHSLLRSEDQDCTLTPTPPWQQSLGLVTSSAEQEEGCSAQDSGDENSSETNNTTPRPAARGCLESHDVTEERTPLLPLERSLYNSPSFAAYPISSIGKVVRSGLGDNTWCSPSPSGPRGYSLALKESSTRQHSGTLLSHSLAWEDFPFSESLTEFLCEANEVAGETVPNLSVHCCKQTGKTHLEIPKPAGDSASAGQRNLQIKATENVTKTSAPGRGDGGGGHDLSDPVCKNPVERLNRCEAEGGDQEGDEARLSFGKEEQPEEDSYNCSADLFSSSLLISMDAEALSKEAEIVRTATETCAYPFKTDRQRPMNENASSTQLTPHRRMQKRNKCNCENDLIPQDQKDLDFVPPSQSTPVVKVHVVTQSHATCSRTSRRCSHRPNEERGFRKPHKRLKLQRRTLNLESVRNFSCEHESRVSDVTDCDFEDDEGIVAPTPAGKRQQSMSECVQTHNSSSVTGSAWKWGQADGVDCKRPVFGQMLTSSLGSVTQTRSNGSRTVFEGSLDVSNDYIFNDENQTCDWSRDLFSDSI
ncbi:uncharacterized protein ddias [Leuresthes tenuis]|uniref:uncharacterized protein ddias n=1 Tax=Leuresthes tenuis TaxID=355514 RepID=UPI003B511537